MEGSFGIMGIGLCGYLSCIQYTRGYLFLRNTHEHFLRSGTMLVLEKQPKMTKAGPLPDGGHQSMEGV